MGCFKHLPILHALASYICNEFDQPAPHPKYKREETLFIIDRHLQVYIIIVRTSCHLSYIYNLNNNNLVILRSTVTVKCC